MNNGIIFNLTNSAAPPNTHILYYALASIAIFAIGVMVVDGMKNAFIRGGEHFYILSIMSLLILACGAVFTVSHLGKDLKTFNNYRIDPVSYYSVKDDKVVLKSTFDAKIKEKYNLAPYVEDDGEGETYFAQHKDNYKNIKTGVIHRDCDEHFKRINAKQVELLSITCGSEILK